MIKYCWFCKWCDYEEPYRYSTLTEGGGILMCIKGHYYDNCTISEFTTKGFEIAEDCPDFTYREDVKFLVDKQAGLAQ